MKLSILIFVLATIVYGCQCAPNPSWWDDEMKAANQQREEYMRQIQEQMERANQQREESMRKMHEQLERANQQREESMRKMHEQLETARQQREESMRKMHEQLETARQQREEIQKQWEITGNSPSIIRELNDYTTNGVHTHHRVQEQLVNHVRERTVVDYSSTTGKTEIKKYKCTSSTESSCVLESTEIKDGVPEGVSNIYISNISSS